MVTSQVLLAEDRFSSLSQNLLEFGWWLVLISHPDAIYANSRHQIITLTLFPEREWSQAENVICLDFIMQWELQLNDYLHHKLIRYHTAFQPVLWGLKAIFFHLKSPPSLQDRHVFCIISQRETERHYATGTFNTEKKNSQRISTQLWYICWLINSLFGL